MGDKTGPPIEIKLQGSDECGWRLFRSQLLFRILAERGFRIAIDRAEIIERREPMDEVE